MEVKIKDQNGYIEADWTIKDGVMIVSPKKSEKIDLSQFKDGDILYCSWGGDSTAWDVILKGKVENMDNTHVFIEDYCSLFLTGDKNLEIEGYSDSATFIRHATEEEKKRLFDKLAEKGLEWDAEKRQLVKLKWKPKHKESYFRITFEDAVIVPYLIYWKDDIRDNAYYQKGWCFKTKEECQEFCDRLNKALENIKS